MPEGSIVPFLVAFGVLFVAELGDKTQLALIALAGRHQRRGLVLGVTVALAVMTALAVAVGETAARFLDAAIIRWVAAGLFFAAGAWSLYRAIRSAGDHDAADAVRPRGGAGFAAGFITVILLEMGDKTQLATIALAAHYSAPVAVFLGAFLALVLISVLAIVLGGALAARLRPRVLDGVAGAAFLLVGLLVLLF